MLKNIYKKVFLNFLYYPVRYELLGNVFPVFPTVLQFPLTNKCNSHCQMCNLWKNNDSKDISPEEIRKILENKLFKNIQSVGLNGGEPTLRDDLIDIVEILIESFPKLNSVNIITNGVDSQNCLDKILKINNLLKKNDISLNVSISIDGIGQIHDKNRGVKGNFDSAECLLDNLKLHNVDVWCGCTITPINCYWVDDILNWFIKKELKYAEFRLGVDINRLHNKGFEETKSFNQEQKLHLSQFFRRIINDKNLNWVGNKEFMQSLYLQLTENKPRQAGCAWKYNGITLDANGNLSFCSVNSPVIGSCLESNPYELYKNNLKIRSDIIKNDCKNCKHDLTGITPLKYRLEKINNYLNNLQDKFYIKNKIKSIINSNKTKETYIPPNNWKKILIVGWWGTETTGDKAILH